MVVGLMEEGSAKTKKKLAHCLRLRLRGEAWDEVRNVKPKSLSRKDGMGRLLGFRKEVCPENAWLRTKDAMEKFQKKSTGRNREPVVDWLFRVILAKEEVMKEEPEYNLDWPAWTQWVFEKARLSDDDESKILTATRGSWAPDICIEKM